MYFSNCHGMTRGPHLGEDLLDKVIALGFHILESAGEEDADFAGVGLNSSHLIFWAGIR